MIEILPTSDRALLLIFSGRHARIVRPNRCLISIATGQVSGILASVRRDITYAPGLLNYFTPLGLVSLDHAIVIYLSDCGRTY